MAPADKPPRVRKRNRKRKRRNVSSSSSSSSSEEEDEQPRVVPTQSKPPPPPAEESKESDADSDSDSSSSSSGSSTSSIKPTQADEFTGAGPSKLPTRRQPPSRSPSPSTVAIPPLIPSNPTTDAEKEKDKALKEKFRKFWMASVADGFKDDLEEIRKEPNLSSSRLSLLIDSLASGADVFSTTSQHGGKQVNEMEVVVGSKR